MTGILEKKVSTVLTALDELSEEVLALLKDKANWQNTGTDTFERFRLGLKDAHGVYAIFFDDELTYIGKTRSARDRFRDHFVKKSDSTASKLEAVEKARVVGMIVSVAFVALPTEVYSAVEERLIQTVPDLKNARAS